MTTATLTERPIEVTERYDEDHPTPRPGSKPAAQRYRTANREWYPGLCTTCVNHSDCTFPRSVAHALLNCDEFEGQAKPPIPTRAVRQDERPRWLAANREWYPGLRSA
jgi:hypothetical protein